MKVHLLEPYRSAFVARCIVEGLIESVPPEAIMGSAALLKCGTSKLIKETLQLTVLASDVSMVWTNIGSVPLEMGLPYMKVSGIENMGVVDLISNYPADIVEQEKNRWQNLTNLNDLWQLERDEIDDLYPLITAQLNARGKGIHWSLFRLLRALRLGEEKAVPVILTAVPPELHQTAESILQIKPRLIHEIELPIFTTLQELRLTFATASKNGVKIVGAAPVTEATRPEIGNSTHQLSGLVVEELIGEQIQFPVPESISDVISLRGRSEVDDFRGFLVPFLDNIIAGKEDSFNTFRKNLKQCVKAFKRFPITQRLARWTSYAGLAADVVEAITNYKGIGIGIGIVGLGLERLAGKWKDMSSWLFMGTSKAT